MKKLTNILFSMASSVILLLIFAISIGYATFIESKENTEVARQFIYNAFWFEALFILLIINLLGSIVKYEILSTRKLSVLVFHLAFIIILIGAGITRYFGSEGIMHIREGEVSNEISSDKTSLRITASVNNETVSKSDEIVLNESTNDYNEVISIAGKEIEFDMVSFIPNSTETIVPDPSGEAAISIFTMNSQNNGMDFILQKGESTNFEGIQFAFEDTTSNSDIVFFRKDNELYFNTKIALSKTNMMEQKQEMILPNSERKAEQKTIFRTENLLFVLKTYLPNAQKNITQLTPEMNKAGIMIEGKNALVFNVTDGEKSQRINILNGNDGSTSFGKGQLNGVDIKIEYGTLTQKLPFSLKLRDFILERYPGSSSPSSFASEILVIDTDNQTEMPYRIFMNNILKYKGYRFFQSSYDEDEKGTVLSVSNDYWGTTITYIGYFLLMFGMLVTMFNKHSRFRTLLKLSAELQQKRNKTKLTVILALIASISFAHATISKSKHIESLNQLLIQDAAQGRIEPFNTYTSDVFRKINKSTSYNSMSATEVVLNMIANPESWQNEPIIKVANDDLAKELGALNNYVSFNQLFDYDNGGTYRLTEKVDAVYKKEQTARNKYDKELINLDERVNICYQLFTGELLHLFPNPNNSNEKWQTAIVKHQSTTDSVVCTRNMVNEQGMNGMMVNSTPPPGMGGMSEEQINAIMGNANSKSDTKNVPTSLFENYLQSVRDAYTNGDWQTANEQLNAIKRFQIENGGINIPTTSRIKMEILYNDLNLFGKLGIVYIIIGMLLLFMYLFQIFNPKSNLKKYNRWVIFPFLIAFTAFTGGLVARWYISGHAPWSNGYETMLFVGWAASLSGLIFARKSLISLAVTGILAAIALFVAGMSWMNPEITNLVPVLKSYWLIIHVAIITSSYGFLAMGALLGLLNLTLMISRNKKNNKYLDTTIQEITIIIELALYIGLVLITSGCFIGGVWANESWGRYWGWDPKETWALVSILVYSAILHLRNVPKLNNRFTLSTLALVGFSTIIMTFFGVNYYLSGMHSYGQGTPPTIPAIVYLILAVLGIIIVAAFQAEKKSKNLKS
ncbi:MAG: cytochrome c biogenesis protein CcsA [Paludibacter sp.]